MDMAKITGASVSIHTARIGQHCDIILNPNAAVNHRAFAGRRLFGLYPLNSRRLTATISELTVFLTRFMFKPPKRDWKQNCLYRMQDLCSCFLVLCIRLILLSRKVFFENETYESHIFPHIHHHSFTRRFDVVICIGTSICLRRTHYTLSDEEHEPLLIIYNYVFKRVFDYVINLTSCLIPKPIFLILIF
jgi:hypothetical protein